jgi:lipoprotein-releasing system permease protein
MKLSFNIAVRFLKSNILQTIIIIVGIGVGVSVQIFIGSLIQGLQKGLVDRTIGNSSQITILPEENETLTYDKDFLNLIKNSDSRIEKVSPSSDNPAFLTTDEKSQSVLVRGFDLDEADKIYNFSEYKIEGNLPYKENEIMIGSKIKEEYGLSVNDEITLITTTKETVNCVVSGFFDLKVAQINSNWCIASLETANNIFKTDNKLTSIEMQVKQVKNEDVFLADEIAENVKTSLNNDKFIVENWKVQNEQLLSGLQGQSISSLMIQVFVMISVILGISSVLAITVMQKSKQIGILKAMGIKNFSSSLIFLFEGLILGVFGAIAGVGLGLGLAVSFTKFALNPDGTPVIDLYIDNNFIILSAIIAAVACILASLIPAIKSSKLNPIDIIRNN